MHAELGAWHVRGNWDCELDVNKHVCGANTATANDKAFEEPE